jgi:hypothetical protein
VTLAPKGLLIEEQRTNSALYSEQLDNVSWSKTQSSVTANAVVAPDGTLTGDLLIPTAGVSFASTGCATVSLAKNGTYAGSIYIKQATGFTFAAVSVAAFGGNTIVAFINLLTGETAIRNDGAASGAVATAVNVGNGWWRLSVSGIPKVGDATTGISVSVAPAGSLATFVFPAANGTDGIYVWGAQLEAGAFPTSYIPTTTAAATRAADVAVMTGANFSNWYNAVEGTMFVEGSFASSSIFQGFVALNDSSSSNRVEIRTDISVILSASSVNASFASVHVSDPTVNKTTKNAVAYASANSAQAQSANLLKTSTTTLGAVAANRLALFMRDNQTAPVGAGYIRRLAFFPRRLADAELTSITS